MVWHRIVSGDRIHMFCDFYGGHWIELRPRGSSGAACASPERSEMFEIRTPFRKAAASARAATTRWRKRGSPQHTTAKRKRPSASRQRASVLRGTRPLLARVRAQRLEPRLAWVRL